ncbi:MAG TPA: zinc ribbon domain-containing protein [Polyangiaceae bacterium]
MANVFQRAIESRPNVAAPAGEAGENVDVPTCPNCGAPREREQPTCRYCGEEM